MSTDLPRALQAWRTQLSLFPNDLAVGIGPLVARLSLALGPLHVRAQKGTGEPDGFDGLVRRGNYERLLASEWLLADEAPDEFARRASAGEHAFLRLSVRKPQGSRHSVALFDAGPLQLGSPRIAQLAALLALAQRAEHGGARFAWGLLQNDTLLEEVTPASVKQLLLGRSLRSVDDGTLTSWDEKLPPPTEIDDLWLIGGPDLEPMARARKASLLLAHDVFEPNARKVLVSVRPRNRSEARVELELPPPRQCVRLLRDPFEVANAAPTKTRVRASPGANLLFSPLGRHVVTRLTDGFLMAQPIPNSPNAGPGNIIRCGVPTGEVLVSAGWLRKRMALVTRRGNEYLLRELGRNGGPAGRPITLASHPDKPFDELSTAEVGVPPFIRTRIGSEALRSEESFFCTADGRLFTLLGTSMVFPIASGVKAIAPFYGQLAWVCDSTESSSSAPKRRIEVHDGFTGKVLPCPLEGDGPMDAFFGFGGSLSVRGLGGICAVRHKATHWRMVFGHGGPTTYPEIEHPASDRVVGVARDPHHAGEPALVTVRPDKRTLALVGRQTWRTLPPASGEIVQAAASHADSLVAWVTREGELVVYSLDQDAALVRRMSESNE